jgi:hypothetical protein
MFSGNVCDCPFTSKQKVLKLQSSIIAKHSEFMFVSKLAVGNIIEVMITDNQKLYIIYIYSYYI